MNDNNIQPQPTNYTITFAVTLRHPDYCNHCRFHNREWNICDARQDNEECTLLSARTNDNDYVLVDYQFATARPTWCPLTEGLT